MSSNLPIENQLATGIAYQKELYPFVRLGLQTGTCALTAASFTAFPGVLTSLQQANLDDRRPILNVMTTPQYRARVLASAFSRMRLSILKGIFFAGALPVSGFLKERADDTLQMNSPQSKLAIDISLSFVLAVVERLATIRWINELKRLESGWATTITGSFMEQKRFEFVGFNNLVLRSSVKIGLVIGQPAIEKMIEKSPLSNPMLAVMMSISAAAVMKTLFSLPFEGAHARMLESVEKNKTVQNVPSTMQAMQQSIKAYGWLILFRGGFPQFITAGLAFASIRVGMEAADKMTHLMNDFGFFSHTPLACAVPVSTAAMDTPRKGLK